MYSVVQTEMKQKKKYGDTLTDHRDRQKTRRNETNSGGRTKGDFKIHDHSDSDHSLVEVKGCIYNDN
jgi:hypothetical protein